jgi:hypothetical protein
MDGMDGPEIGYFLSLPGMGVPVLNTFTAQVMAGDRAVKHVSFTLGGRTQNGHESSGRWTADFDMSELQPGRQKLEVVAYDERDLASPTFTVTVYMVSRPVWYGQSWVLNSHVSWSKAAQQYTFTCHVPNNPPLRFQQDISFQYLGSLRNVFASDVALTEVFQVSGGWTYSAKGTLEATILGATGFYKEYKLTPDLERGPDDPWYKLSALRFQTEMELPGWEKNIVDDKTIATFVVLGIKFDVKLSVDIGYEAELSIQGRILSNLSVDEIRLTPAVSPYVQVDIALDILCGVATVGSQIRPTVTFYLPIVYDSTPPSGKNVLYLDTPCVLFKLRAKLYVKLFWGLGQWDSGWYDLAKTDWPEDCAESEGQALQWAQEPPPSSPPDLFVAPAIAVDGAGRVLALWVEDVDPAPDSADPELYYAVRQSGVWGPAQPLTADDYWQADPQVAFLTTGQALAVWTQNKLDRTHVISDLNTVLNGQELYYALWNGTGWIETSALTADEFPDGRVSLAAGPGGQAMAVWVHDVDGQTETRGDWEIHFVMWNGTNWTAPAAIAPDAERADLEPSVAYDHTGGAMAVWVRDGDGDPLTVEDRRVAYARWNGATWSDAVVPQDWPAGALWPTVAFGQDNHAVVVFTARGHDTLGQWYGEGLQDLLWSARESNVGWELAPVGQDTVADRPRVAVNAQNYALIVYRGFTGGGPVGYAGDVAAAVANLSAPTLQWGPPGFLTVDAQRDWQLASTVDTQSGDMLIVDVRETASAGQAAALHVPGAMQPLALSALQGEETVQHLAIPFGADLAITTTDLSFSAPHPQAGATISITALVHNLGFQDVLAGTDFVLRFYVDSVSTPNLIGEAVVSARIGYNGTYTVTIPWAALAGRHDIIVVADAGGQVLELNESNNQARRAVGEVVAPRFLVAAADPAGEQVLLNWEPSSTVGVVGYRVYRSLVPGGGYGLVATLAGTYYADSGLPNGIRQYYVVSAVDAFGTESPVSEESSAVPLRTISGRCYLPLVVKK